MGNKLDNKFNLPISDLSKQADEDINTYLQAVLSWVEPPEGYSHGYILILMLSSRARGCRAFELMATDEFAELSNQKEQLISLWLKAEKLLENLVFKDDSRLEDIIKGELIQRLNGLERDIYEVRHIAQDGDLIGDYDWAAENLRDIAIDFLLRFQDMFLTKKELEQSSLKNSENFKHFQERFNEIEQYFKRYFGYFYPTADFLYNLRKREYGLNTWWLTSAPERDDVDEEDISEDVMKEFWSIYRSTDKITTEACPEPELVIAYALGELPSRESINIQNHILKCRPCLDLVTDVRYTEMVTKDVEREEVEASEEFFSETRNELLHDEESEDTDDVLRQGQPVVSEPSPPYYAPILDFMMIDFIRAAAITAILLKEIKLRAHYRIVAEGEGEQEPFEFLSEPLPKCINLRLKVDEWGEYTLPHTPEKEPFASFDSMDAYKKINDFIKKAKTYWGGFAQKCNGEVKKFEPDEIRPRSLSRLEIGITPKDNYDYVIICIAGNRNDVIKGLEAIQKRDKELMALLDAVWLICSLEK